MRFALASPRDRRGWIKTNNPNYWRRESEREAMSRRRSRAGKLQAQVRI